MTVASAEQAVTITTKPVEVRALKRTVEMVGTLSGWEEVTISNETPGTIEKILVDLGDRVKKGQLLIRFDQREARLALAQAEANLKAAEKALAQAQAEWRDADTNLKRVKELHTEGVIATSQLDVAQSRFDAVEAQVRAREADLERFRALVELARKRQSDTEIVAPIAGEVRQRLVSSGETVKDKTPMLQLVVTDPLKFQGAAPERFAPEIKPEQPLDVQVEAFADRVFPGVIQRVSPAVDVQTRSLALEARAPNTERLLKPGFFAKGLIFIGVNPRAVFAPEEAVSSYVGITKAFVVADGVAQDRQVTVVANLHNKPLGEAMLQGTAAVKELNLGPDYATTYLGRGKIMIEALQNFAIAFVLSIVFIYIVLAAQFESFIHPVTIMVSMFLSLPFGVLSLILTDNPLSIYSVLGVFLLMGVVKKNAILQVDYTNHLRAQGMSRHDAQLTADRGRLRPILMTTLTIIAGMLPIALGRGDGAAARASLATVVVGGQAMCLLITLLVTPVVYSFFDDFRGLRLAHFSPFRLWRWTRARAATAAALLAALWTGMGRS